MPTTKVKTYEKKEEKQNFTETIEDIWWDNEDDEAVQATMDQSLSLAQARSEEPTQDLASS